ncbi:CBS domain-containing protein [Amycolatopsis aidingensis]|uniref:CBS domain-containing protein n=1 Tax=Amycolatopsis aidingensis TaxID=2842453 RepID=UPI001C0CC96A|nr:CBS domain-containing protein [Amycolatopsis aidingensis]
MRVRDLMSKPVITVTADCPVRRAAGVLAHHGFSALPVVDESERLAGIVTEADLMRGRFPRDRTLLTARGERLPPIEPATTVGQVMITRVISIGGEADVVDLVRLMLDERRRSVPVVDGDRLHGIATGRDVMRVLGRSDEVLARDIRHRLAFFGGPSRWTVEVHDGKARIVDRFDSEVDRRVATVLAENVPGVVRAECVAAESASAAGGR